VSETHGELAKIWPPSQAVLQSSGLDLSSFPFQDIQLHVNPAWGSDQPNFRAALSAAEALALKSIGVSDGKLALLSESKVKKYSFLSRSHSLGMGGFAILPPERRLNLGFDLELSSRVEPKLANRIKHEQESSLQISPASLWTAKEASFKAMSSDSSLKFLSQLETFNWKSLDSRNETFQVRFQSRKTSTAGWGWTFNLDKYCLCLVLGDRDNVSSISI
jgi:hypothetical protein